MDYNTEQKYIPDDILERNREISRAVLEEFLSYSICETAEIMNRFADLPNAVQCRDGNKRNYVFVPGSRTDRVVLAAHADTVWDEFYTDQRVEIQKVKYDGKGVYYSGNCACGIGADDRAGCAILWLLRDMGHSLLILDGEEHHQIGANHLHDTNPELFRIVNDHSYILQFDRRGSSDYKTYSIPVTDEFIKYIEMNTGYISAGNTARTDIVALCDEICGVNLSVGYYDEHRQSETLIFDDWYHTLEISAKMLAKFQPKFVLQR